MKIIFDVPLFMVKVCMISIVVAIPAAVVAPVPASVPYRLASMLLAMVPFVFIRMANFTEIIAPIVTPITIVVVDDRSTGVWCIPGVLMFSIRR